MMKSTTPLTDAPTLSTPLRPGWLADALIRVRQTRLGGLALSARAIPLALAVVTFLTFSPALWNGFVEWDDAVTITNNLYYRGLGWEQIRWMLTTTLMGHYIPLTWLTLGLDYVLWGMNPAGYHLTNLALQSADAALFYLVARRLFEKATTLSAAARTTASVVAALFFAIHPLRAESVAWATERRDVLSGVFYFLTILTYLRACEAGGKRKRLLTISLASYLLALASKGIVMTLPLVLLIFDLYPLRRLPADPRRWREPVLRAVWLEKIPYVMLALIGGAATYYAQHVYFTPLQKYPWYSRIGIASYAVWFYVSKTALPLKLSPLYELPYEVSLLEPRFFLSIVAIGGLTGATVLARKRWPAGLALWAYYGIVLAPVSGILHAGHQIANDRYTYLPSLAWSILIGAAAGAVVLAWEAGLLRPVLAGVTASVATLWLLGLAVLTGQQVQIWHDTDTLWRFAIESQPDCTICHGNLGVLLTNKGAAAPAREHFERVLALRPDRVTGHGNLALALINLGEHEKALEHFKVALAESPNDVDLINNFGVDLIGLRRYGEAAAQLERAVQINPNHPAVQTNLGIALVELGRPAEALEHFRIAIAMRPKKPQVRFARARAHLALGQTELALREYGVLRDLDPGLASVLGPAFLSQW